METTTTGRSSGRRAKCGADGSVTKPQTVDIELLIFFNAVAETLSFTRAAKNLGIDQSWLSHKIRSLEDIVGVKLFTRSTRRVELTEAGRTMCESTRRLAQVAEQARAASLMLRNAPSGGLHVGALPFSFNDNQRTEILDTFMRKHPDVQLRIVNGATPFLIDQLYEGAIDAAFVSAPVDLEKFDAILLRENTYCLLAPKEHVLADMEPVSAESLAGHKIAIPSKRYSPASYDMIYGPLVEAGMLPVHAPEFECAIGYGADLRIPIVCTAHAAKRNGLTDYVMQDLPFVDRCQKYLIRLKDHRTAPQEALWKEARQVKPAPAKPALAKAH